MPDLSYEIMMGRNEGKIVCGVDEVGRGPLAGPVVAAAAILPASFPDDLNFLIKDSKAMTAKRREELFPRLAEICRYAIAEASVQEITQLNILQASLLAMRRAVLKLGLPLDAVLVDGNQRPPLTPEFQGPLKTVIGGDNLSLSIAAASILAKVTRDRLMRKLAIAHPGYGWEKNAGYGTAEHLAALSQLGPTEWHRDSFAPVSQLKLLRG